jgi:CCR4-NOT transcriptional regulation complex NOT5 subunit
MHQLLCVAHVAALLCVFYYHPDAYQQYLAAQLWQVG